MDTLPVTPETTLHRAPHHGSYDRALIDSILDEGLVCHVGFVVEDQPYVIPMVYARDGDQLLLHGASVSRILRTLSSGVLVCATVTILDGVVFARSAFNHSMNYRSVVVLGRAREVLEDAERRAALELLVEHVLKGRYRQVRPPNAKELKATGVLTLPITKASAKVRTGGPNDYAEDLAVACWAGHVPIALHAGAPVMAPASVETEPPEAIRSYRRT